VETYVTLVIGETKLLLKIWALHLLVRRAFVFLQSTRDHFLSSVWLVYGNNIGLTGTICFHVVWEHLLDNCIENVIRTNLKLLGVVYGFQSFDSNYSNMYLIIIADNVVSDSDLDVAGFEVKNLTVVDETWAKPKRIYSENPWLNIFPHLKLKVYKVSLYGDSRNPPKVGYLSTIESIVFSLQAFGESREGLNNLLDTFESMF